MRRGFITVALGLVAAAGCTDERGRFSPEDGGGDPIIPRLADGGGDDPTCASVSAEADLRRAPVDIIWVVDNSSSMEPAVAEIRQGLNEFAALIAASGLDYRVIMLSLRDPQLEVDLNGRRYAICIPEPLAGNANCGDGERFFHSSVDIKSTQPLEQFLGTLAQTPGYVEGDARGGEPWRDHLRPEASKSIVIVTDDNSRLSAQDFQHFAGGTNPNNSMYTLPAGILEESEWGSLFRDFVFHALYSYVESDPNAPCTYPGGGTAENAGTVYTTLVEQTGGVRASICDGHTAWGPFFSSVATDVVDHARIACELDLPEPPAGQRLDPTRVNVVVRTGAGETTLRKTTDASSCPASGGWYYDSDDNPTQVILCPGSCADLQDAADEAGSGVDVEFGCATLVI